MGLGLGQRRSLRAQALVNTAKSLELEFQPFEFLGQRLLGAEITDAVDRNLLTASERDDLRRGLLSEDEVTALAASRFYESLSQASLQAADLFGSGIVACKERTFFFVRSGDWRCECDIDVAALMREPGTGARPLAALEHQDSASVVRLGPNQARAVLGRCWADRRSYREVSERGLEYLLEHY